MVVLQNSAIFLCNTAPVKRFKFFQTITVNAHFLHAFQIFVPPENRSEIDEIYNKTTIRKLKKLCDKVSIGKSQGRLATETFFPLETQLKVQATCSFHQNNTLLHLCISSCFFLYITSGNPSKLLSVTL